MKSNRFISDHPEFGAFLKKELKQLDIRREAFRSTCHMKQNYLEDIKKGSIIMRYTTTRSFLAQLKNSQHQKTHNVSIGKG